MHTHTHTLVESQMPNFQTPYFHNLTNIWAISYSYQKMILQTFSICGSCEYYPVRSMEL